MSMSFIYLFFFFFFIKVFYWSLVPKCTSLEKFERPSSHLKFCINCTIWTWCMEKKLMLLFTKDVLNMGSVDNHRG